MSQPFLEATKRALLQRLRGTDEGEDTAEVKATYDEVNEKYRDKILAGAGATPFNEITIDDVQKVANGNKPYSYRVQERLYSAIVNTPADPPPANPTLKQGGRRRSAISTKFNRCVKSVRKTVKARRGSNKESAAIAICTTSVLHPRKRTIKKYRKGRLVTQRRKAF